MKFVHRLAYYGLGLFFGIVILIFFLGGKKTSCDYSPNARVLKNIKIKERNFSENSMEFFKTRNIDTSLVSEILKNGDVDFNKSDTEATPCNIYFISGGSNAETIELEIENCDSIATIKQAYILKDG
ncbi:DUF4258 domain-containing protein [Christiangramia sabulilitoris]|uniref:DUF4258 domain-containing protein n=1 Tax=Christiangramia sabulilitoris TaxID=2583991 RepID=A0A550I5W1_9FLAO|nr:DUF4258 domain-containing protein [Christiangramia sabulilitoris]TRO66356.1 DUF4258 domain-containing protein [Christiangramia sabulilitoris]